MSGRILVIGLIAFSLLFGVALFWFQNYAYYEEVAEQDVITVEGLDVAVTGWQGIDAPTSPIKARACFRIDPRDVDGLGNEGDATPLTAPFWFDCFDAETLAQDIEAGRATAMLAEKEVHDGADRYIAWYPDGRAYQWNQLNDKYEN
ncbi:DUF6446 family protein [Paracoccaceae bacterium GXU_MW_L88]